MDLVKFVEDGRKKFEGIWFAEADHIPSNFLRAVFHKSYLVHSGIFCLIAARPVKLFEIGKNQIAVLEN